MSRALGDLDCKLPSLEEAVSRQDSARPPSGILDSDLADPTDKVMLADWISNIPHTNYKSLTGARRHILLLASDGLGEERDGASSLRWVAQKWEGGGEATHLARQLAEMSSKRTADNSTVLIVVLG